MMVKVKGYRFNMDGSFAIHPSPFAIIGTSTV